ncbi:MAG TPA: BatD family protein, partial [Candidatus Polarisedimenticolia bacterium]|nr:BatD family protein [Candidatus Polarisedimenticolia bacterium]
MRSGQASRRRRTARLRLGTIVVATALGAHLAAAQDVSVRARVDRTSIAQDEEVVLSIDILATNYDQATPPDLSRLSDFDIESGPNVSSRFQWINGKTSASRTYSYVLRPRRTGTLTIPSLGLLIQGRTYRTRPLQVEVRTGSASGGVPSPMTRPSGPGVPPPAPEPPRGIDVSVRAEVDLPTAYVGQQVTARFLLDTRTEVLNLDLKESPTFPGFWAEDVKVPENLDMRRVQIRGENYIEYTLMKKALFPTSSGTLTIPPVTYQIQVRRRGQDPLESFFFTPTETVVRKTAPITLTVLPLPREGRPEDFSGAVGRFNLSVSADRKDAQVNDAVGVKVRISGEGSLNAVTRSPLPEVSDFKQYDPKVSSTTTLQGDRLRGEKTWDYVLIPLAPGGQAIPAVSFSYFDPQAREYRSVTSDAIPIQVARGEAGAGGSYPAMAQSDVRAVHRDIHYIKLASGSLRDESIPLYRRPLFLVLLALPVAADVGAVIAARRRGMAAANAR